MKFPHIARPGKIADMELGNRIVMAPMGSNLAEEDGHCGERLISYYEQRARGGTGLIIVETTSVSWPAGTTMPRQIGLSKEEFLPGLKQLAERVHRHGSKLAVQLNHGGKVSQEDTAAGRPVMVVSIPQKKASDMFASLTQEEIATFIKAAGPDGKGPRYHVMKEADIQVMVEQFANAAELVKRAGFDAVEIHAGHGYILASFISPYSNRRTDQYGGGVENRARFLVEVIKAVREKVGEGFPILCRLDAKEYRIEGDGGIHIEDAVAVSKLAVAAGCDAIDVSAYADTSSGIGFTEAPLVHEPAGFVGFAKTIKQAVSVPVIGVGRIEPDVAEKSIARGGFDFVAMGRKLLADPELPNKLIAGDVAAIRPCIYCYVCVGKIFLNEAMCCAANPGTGREQALDIITPAAQAKNVLVVGGGPGGMEAARVLALRGHKVTLWEKAHNLGGTARIAALAYEPNERLVNYLQESIQRLPVKIELNKTATLEAIKALAPDEVVVATGARREAPAIKGKQLRHVFDGEELRAVLFGGDKAAMAKLGWFKSTLISISRLLRITDHIGLLRRLSYLYMPFGKDITVIGGGLVGLEVAELLAERGRRVTVLEPSQNLGPELSVVRRWRVLHELASHHVEIHRGVEIDRIEPQAVYYSVDGESRSVAAKQVIIAMGAQPDTGFSQQLTAQGISAHAIGDCKQIAYIEGAMLAAREVAQTL